MLFEVRRVLRRQVRHSFYGQQVFRVAFVREVEAAGDDAVDVDLDLFVVGDGVLGVDVYGHALVSEEDVAAVAVGLLAWSRG